ncbi:UNVERIFIED_CONTAM: hypothetical protein Sradi_3815000 [Sesamum radiatum]|uniref:Uncharacterized protein n=1 Tax=Sesamum radiatum TaxID=300843 RepID=A0AAW2Q148_SESRA
MADGRENNLPKCFCLGRGLYGSVEGLLLEMNRKSVVSKGPSMALSKLPEAGTHVLMRSYRLGRVPTDSTMEAEYITASEAAKEAVWKKNYIQELGVVLSIAEPVVIFCDNNRAIAQGKEPRSHHHSKHILRRYHLLKEMVSRGDCMMDRVSSAENTADPLTKSMSQIAHTQHLDKMGLRSMGDWL